MKLFNCNTQRIPQGDCQRLVTFTLVDLPRHSWHVIPPRRWQIALTLAGIVVTAIVWAVI